jgi:hypothetical protein
VPSLTTSQPAISTSSERLIFDDGGSWVPRLQVRAIVHFDSEGFIDTVWSDGTVSGLQASEQEISAMRSEIATMKYIR